MKATSEKKADRKAIELLDGYPASVKTEEMSDGDIALFKEGWEQLKHYS